MKTINIIIPKRSIENAVSENSAYAGAKGCGEENDGRLFDRVSTVEEDSSLLSRFLTDAFGVAQERLKSFVADAGITDSEIRLTLSASEAADETLLLSIPDTFEAFLSAAVTARWMRFTFPEKVAEWEHEASRLLSELENRLLHRKPPRRRPAPVQQNIKQ